MKFFSVACLSYLILPCLTSVLDISACPKGFWNQSINLMELNYAPFSQLDITSNAKNISHSGTQCHSPVLLNIILTFLDN